MIKIRTDNQGTDGEEKKLATPMSPDMFNGGTNGWLNLCATSIAGANGSWSGRADAHSGARANDDLIIIISNIQDIG
jgi:hypothetical protein